MNPTNPNFKIEEADAAEGAKKLNIQTVTLTARNAAEMETALQQLLSAKAQASDPILLDGASRLLRSRYSIRCWRWALYNRLPWRADF